MSVTPASLCRPKEIVLSEPTKPQDEHSSKSRHASSCASGPLVRNLTDSSDHHEPGAVAQQRLVLDAPK